MPIEEKQLILPTLYIIDRDGPASTTDLIRELTALFNPTGEDAEILAGRSDTKFSQKVRNLKSHRNNNGMNIYTKFVSCGNIEKYELTKKGGKYLEENREQMDYLFSNKFHSSEISAAIDAIDKAYGKKHTVYVYSEEDMIIEGKTSKKTTINRERSKKLRAAAIDYYRKGNGKVYCEICGFCFEDKYGELGKDYIEIHHEQPLFQYSDAGFKDYISAAIEKVKPVCANCHRMIHRDSKRPKSIDELKGIISK